MSDGPGNKNRRDNARKKNVKKGKKRFSARKLFVWLFFTAAFAVICGIIGYLLIILNGQRILSENQSKLDMPEAAIIYDANGKEVTKLGQNRESVEYKDIPPQLREAFIATEDRRFEEHSGVDLWSIGRALVKDVVARSAVEGGSTITQQLAKNMFLSHDKTFFRKATEASIAVALEQQYTKDEILTMYLNRIYFGKGAWGVEAAAELYFNTPLNQLKLWQIATLAAIPKAPSNYNPIDNPDSSKERRAVVLQLMYEQKYITKEQMDEANVPKYSAKNFAKPQAQLYPSFVDFVMNEAEERTGLTEEQLRSGGFKIYTTLNTKAQSVIEKEFADDGNFEKSVDDQEVQGAMIIVDHRNGNIQGLIGGRDYVHKGLNRVLVPRQPGSGFKPITVYGPAFETGDWYPWSIVQDKYQCYGNYCPRDSNRVKYLGPITIAQSIKESRNASAVWLLNQIGIQTGLDFAERLGFKLDEKNDRNLAIALGGLYKGVTPLQMATAFSVFANDGRSVDPHSVLKIVDNRNETIYEYDPPASKQLINEQTAWYLTEVMEGVVQPGGTGTLARINRPVAGKTGTTQHGIPGLVSSYNRDAWFSGYTPEWTGVVWMGYDRTDKQHLLKKSSSQAAAMFGKVMREAMEGIPVTDFKKPAGVVDKQPLSPVSGFSAVYDQVSKSVKLSWQKSEVDGITYRVYRKEASEKEYTRLMDAVDATSVDDMSVAPGMTYEYFVTAYDPQSQLESDSSPHATVGVPAEQLQPTQPQQPGDGTIVIPGDQGQLPGGTGDPGTTDPGATNGGGTNGGTGSGTDSGSGAGEPPSDGSSPPSDQSGTAPSGGDGTNPTTGTQTDPGTGGNSTDSTGQLLPDLTTPGSSGQGNGHGHGNGQGSGG